MESTGGCMTFGQVITEARERKNLTQRKLAALIKKEDGSSISAPYLNDLEHDRRNPPSDHLLREFADALDINLDFLYFLAGKLPEDLKRTIADENTIATAYRNLREELRANQQRI
jgi:transcriptional regulator with XRE-family HTH domain